MATDTQRANSNANHTNNTIMWIIVAAVLALLAYALYATYNNPGDDLNPAGYTGADTTVTGPNTATTTTPPAATE